jgi:hypothetical protein
MDEEYAQSQLDWIEKNLGSDPVIRKLLDAPIDEEDLEHLSFAKLPEGVTREDVEAWIRPDDTSVVRNPNKKKRKSGVPSKEKK